MSITDRKQHLASLKDRLEKYKTRSQQIMQKEAEIKADLQEKERLKKAREELRIEAEKQALILELQRVAPTKPKPKPKPKAAATQQLPPPPPPPPTPPPQQQPQQQQPLFPSFGYPDTVTEKEAIDWLRSGF